MSVRTPKWRAWIRPVVIGSLTLCLVAAVWAELAITPESRCRFNHIQQQRPSRLYDFRTREYSPGEESPRHVVSWRSGAHVLEISGASHQYPWTMQAGGTATVIVTRTAPGGSRLQCQKTSPNERVHAILEGPAVVSPVDLVEIGAHSFFHLVAYEPGTYRLHIESVFGCSDVNNSTIVPVIGSPFNVRVAGPPSRFPAAKCSDYRYRHGRWLECHNTPLPCMRSGWVWVPSDCYTHPYSADEIINAPPTWIVFAGSSVERGSFWSLVDHVLGSRAANLTVSEHWVCWGWSK
jgi:hypothetical protein